MGKRLGGAASSRDEGHEGHPGEIRMGQVEFVTCHPHLSQAQAHAHEGQPGRIRLHCHLPSSPVTHTCQIRGDLIISYIFCQMPTEGHFPCITLKTFSFYE